MHIFLSCSAPVPEEQCKFMINEVRLNYRLDNFEAPSFIEIVRICNKQPRHVRQILMKEYHLIFISGVEKQIVMTCHFTEKASVIGKVDAKQLFYVVGSSKLPAESINLRISQCQSIYEDNTDHQFPPSTTTPIGVALLHTPDRGSSYMDVQVNAGVKIGEKEMSKIKRDLIDFMAYSNLSPVMDCSIFNAFFAAGQTIQYFIQSSDKNQAFSLNRCYEESDTFIKFEPYFKTYYHAPATPMVVNDCTRKFSVNIISLVKTITKLDSKELFKIPATHPKPAGSTESSCTYTSLNPTVLVNIDDDKLQKQYRLSTNGPDEPSEPPAFLGSCPRTRSLLEGPAVPVLEGQVPRVQKRWTDCKQFSQRVKNQIIDNLKDVISIQDILVPEICWWAEFELNANNPKLSRITCKSCKHLYNLKLVYEREKSNKWDSIKSNYGLLKYSKSGHESLTNTNARVLQDHAKNNELHLISEQVFMAEDRGLAGQDLEKDLEQDENGAFMGFYKQTLNLFWAAYAAVKMNLSYSAFATFTEYLDKMKVGIGHLFKNRQGLEKIVEFIAEIMRAEFFDWLKKTQPKVTVVMDESVDRAGDQNLVVLFFFAGENLQVKTRLYRYITLKRGTAEAIMDDFKAIVKKDGLEDYLKKNTLGLSTDGAATMRSAVFNLYVEWVNENLALTERRNLMGLWCVLHRLELVIKHGFSVFDSMQKVDRVAQDLYVFFSPHNHKNRVLLKETTKDMDDTAFNLKQEHHGRWIANRRDVVSTILKHWYTIVTVLKKIWTSTDKEFTDEKIAKALSIYNCLIDPQLITNLAFVADVADTLSAASLDLQKRNSNLVDSHGVLLKLENELGALAIDNGKWLTKILDESTCGDVDEEGEEATKCDLETFENEDTGLTKFHGIQLQVNPDESQRVLKVSENRTNYIEKLEEQLEQYYIPSIIDDFQVFTPQRLNDFISDSPNIQFLDYLDKDAEGKATVKNGMTYCKAALLRLSRFFRWVPLGQTSTHLFTEYKAFVESITKTNEYQTHKMKPAAEFFQHYATQPVLWTDTIRAAVKTALVLSATTAEAERYFSYYNKIRTMYRYSLEPQSVDNLVRIGQEDDVDMDSFPMLRYVLLWSGKKTRPDDTQIGGGKRKLKPESCDQDDEFWTSPYKRACFPTDHPSLTQTPAVAVVTLAGASSSGASNFGASSSGASSSGASSSGGTKGSGSKKPKKSAALQKLPSCEGQHAPDQDCENIAVPPKKYRRKKITMQHPLRHLNG